MQPNFTIVTNFKKNGFACDRACVYCNWRKSPLLPHGLQDVAAIREFVNQCTKSFVTISGGGDPLYSYPENAGEFRVLAGVIRDAGYKVRVITREIDSLRQLTDVVDYASVSLSQDTFSRRGVLDGSGITVEYSIVMPPLPTAELLKLKPYYLNMRAELNGRLLLRENLNSIFRLDWEELSFGSGGSIVYVPADICLASRYLSTIDSTGAGIMQDMRGVFQYINASKHTYLFGGMLKHVMYPEIHTDFTDIDICVTDKTVMTELEAGFGYTFVNVSKKNQYPQYFIGRSRLIGKDIQGVLLQNEMEVRRFIFNAQYDVDRMYLHGGELIYDTTVAAKKKNLKKRIAVYTRINDRDVSVFHKTRQLIENKHHAKMAKRGWKFELNN